MHTYRGSIVLRSADPILVLYGRVRDRLAMARGINDIIKTHTRFMQAKSSPVKSGRQSSQLKSRTSEAKRQVKPKQNKVKATSGGGPAWNDAKRNKRNENE